MTGAPARAKRTTKTARPANVVRVSVERGAAAKGLTAKAIEARADKMLAALDLHGVEISVALVGDDAIQTLNRQYRKKDKPTDVLSFAMLEDPTLGGGAHASHPSNEPILLGDVIIATPTAVRQASEHGHALRDEITLLLAHGVLHLLGFDHGTDADEREMNAYARVLEAAASSQHGMRLKLIPALP